MTAGAARLPADLPFSRRRTRSGGLSPRDGVSHLGGMEQPLASVMPAEAPSDEEIARRVLDGDVASFELLHGTPGKEREAKTKCQQAP